MYLLNCCTPKGVILNIILRQLFATKKSYQSCSCLRILPYVTTILFYQKDVHTSTHGFTHLTQFSILKLVYFYPVRTQGPIQPSIYFLLFFSTFIDNKENFQLSSLITYRCNPHVFNDGFDSNPRFSRWRIRLQISKSKKILISAIALVKPLRVEFVTKTAESPFYGIALN